MQAYQKRALAVIDWLADLARRSQRRLMLRLVKGAYWDSEIKRAQERGLDGYPVFTRKVATDVSYLACAKRLLAAGDAFYPQFATHNAHTLAAVLELAGTRRDWEFQRLHGMGEALYAEVVGAARMNLPCRVYAPVGSHEDLLAYLVRRLLENGANTSFVNRIVDEHAPIDEIVADPVAHLARLPVKPHPRHPAAARPVPAGAAEFAGARPRRPARPRRTARRARRCAAPPVRVPAPIVGGIEPAADGEPVVRPERPAAPDRNRGDRGADDGRSRRSPAPCARRRDGTQRRPIRAPPCLSAPPRFTKSGRAELMALIVREGGRTIPAALSEVREAADYLRYYAARARADFAAPEALPGPTGERNEHRACTAAASSPASRRGISRWRSSPARSRRRWPPATRSSPSRPSRRR